MAERDDIGVGRFIEPFAALDEFGAKIPQMRDWAIKTRHPKSKEHPKHFEKERRSFEGVASMSALIMASRLRRRGCGESRNVGKAERLFDMRDLRHGVFKAVLAELLTFDFLELVAHFVELMG